jgi:ribulose-5-phosphate 4-epimerase/fuculose-1-phosphate aldolase
LSKSAASAGAAVASAIDELVEANHILFDQKIVDGFGHVSARCPERADRFLLARSMAPGLVQADDIMTFDLDGAPAAADARPSYLERFIHSEIYRARPDVGAVVHSHSPGVIPFGVARRVRLRPICHMCGFLGRGAPVFEIRDAAGDGSDLLVRSPALGAALARSLGGAAAVLMRGHGATVVGETLRQAVFRAVYTELGARLQAEALRLGPVAYLSAAEARAAAKTNDAQIDRAWSLWRAQARENNSLLTHGPSAQN